VRGCGRTRARTRTRLLIRFTVLHASEAAVSRQSAPSKHIDSAPASDERAQQKLSTAAAGPGPRRIADGDVKDHAPASQSQQRQRQRSLDRAARSSQQEQAMVVACRPACSLRARASGWLAQVEWSRRPRRGKEKEATNSLAAPPAQGTSAHKGTASAASHCCVCVQCMHARPRAPRQAL
jgi:hypothetical protein